jgi:transaldolase
MDPRVDSLKVKLFADGADLQSMVEMASKHFISGLTTNPTLMKKAGVNDYVTFAKSVLQEIKEKPISFEVFSDEHSEMKKQGMEIASWGENVYVKVPVTNTKGQSSAEVVEYLSNKGVKVNVTALMTVTQVKEMTEVLNPKTPSCISVFAGRIADTGRDPMPIISECLLEIQKKKCIELIWASPRELLNVFQADQLGCHIITATNDILNKLEIVGKNLDEYSLETVRMFHSDANSAQYRI